MESSAKLLFTLTISLSIVVMVVSETCNLVPQVKFPDGRMVNRRLVGFSLLSTTAEAAMTCFAKCSEQCQCKSVNFCGKDCQLNFKNQTDAPLSDNADCTYYELSWTQWNFDSASTKTCARKTGCCDYSRPCQNEGKCVDQCPNSGARYRCECPPNVSGENCQNAPRSCRYLYDLDPNLQSGFYTLYDDEGTSYKTYCDFAVDAGKVWTLVMSYSLDNNAHYMTSPLLYDKPRGKNELTWEDFRLSKRQMASIEENTTHWRTTCNYNTQSISDQVDQVRVKNTVINLLNYDANQVPLNERCLAVEYLNIRGFSCTDCTVALIQTTKWMLFTSPSRNTVSGCDWQYPGGHASCEENIGGYECYNSEYRCTSSSTATTQMWFGS